MCDFFSALVTRDHRVLFCEETSHDTLIARAGFTDVDLHLRHWVRVELRPDGDGWQALRVDETTAPSWFDHIEDTDRVRAVADRVRPSWAAYKATYVPALAAYEATRATAHAAAYDAARALAWAAYEAAPALAAYDAARAPAWAAYETAISSMDGYLHANARTTTHPAS